MIQVHHFGIHFAAGSVGFLLQEGPSQALYPIDTPFFTRKIGRCPHRVELAAADETYRELLDDPLVGWFANPKGAVVSYDTDPAFAEQLAQMYCPTEPLLAMGWGNRTWRRHMGNTNLCPWVLVDASSTDMDIVNAAPHSPRPLLCLASSIIPGRRIETNLKTLPDAQALRGLGAWAIRERLKRP